MGTHLHLKQKKEREKSDPETHLRPDSTCTDTEMTKTEHAEQDDVQFHLYGNR